MYDSVWEDLFSSRPWGKYPAEDLVRFVAHEASRASDRSRLKALELGCGPGANLWLLANERIPFDAIDGSPSAVAQSRAMLDEKQPGWIGRITLGDFCRLPDDFRDYDFVVDSESIYCNTADETAKIIGEIYDRLKPGGAFWSRTFAPGTWGVERGTRIGDNYWVPNEGPLVGNGAVRLTPLDARAAAVGLGVGHH